MLDIFGSNALNWLIIAGILIAGEIIIPGVYVIWFGFAAAIMAGIIYFIPLELTTQIVLFSIFSIISTLVGIKINKKQRQKDVNQARGSEYIDQIFTTTQATINGVSRLSIGDTSWIIMGEDCPANTQIKIIGVEVNALKYIINSQSEIS